MDKKLRLALVAVAVLLVFSIVALIAIIATTPNKEANLATPTLFELPTQQAVSAAIVTSTPVPVTIVTTDTPVPTETLQPSDTPPPTATIEPTIDAEIIEIADYYTVWLEYANSAVDLDNRTIEKYYLVADGSVDRCDESWSDDFNSLIDEWIALSDDFEEIIPPTAFFNVHLDTRDGIAGLMVGWGMVYVATIAEKQKQPFGEVSSLYVCPEFTQADVDSLSTVFSVVYNSEDLLEKAVFASEVVLEEYSDRLVAAGYDF